MVFGAEVPDQNHISYPISCHIMHDQNLGQQPYNAYQIEALSFIFSVLLVRTFPLKYFYLYSCVLADFYKFHWTSMVYATLTMRNRFIRV